MRGGMSLVHLSILGRLMPDLPAQLPVPGFSKRIHAMEIHSLGEVCQVGKCRLCMLKEGTYLSLPFQRRAL